MPGFLASTVVMDRIRVLIASESVLCRTGLGSSKFENAEARLASSSGGAFTPCERHDEELLTHTVYDDPNRDG